MDARGARPSRGIDEAHIRTFLKGNRPAAVAMEQRAAAD
jgi:hypothetical protein